MTLPWSWSWSWIVVLSLFGGVVWCVLSKACSRAHLHLFRLYSYTYILYLYYHYNSISQPISRCALTHSFFCFQSLIALFRFRSYLPSSGSRMPPHTMLIFGLASLPFHYFQPHNIIAYFHSLPSTPEKPYTLLHFVADVILLFFSSYFHCMLRLYLFAQPKSSTIHSDTHILEFMLCTFGSRLFLLFFGFFLFIFYSCHIIIPKTQCHIVRIKIKF